MLLLALIHEYSAYFYSACTRLLPALRRVIRETLFTSTSPVEYQYFGGHGCFFALLFLYY